MGQQRGQGRRPALATQELVPGDRSEWGGAETRRRSSVYLLPLSEQTKEGEVQANDKYNCRRRCALPIWVHLQDPPVGDVNLGWPREDGSIGLHLFREGSRLTPSLV